MLISNNYNGQSEKVVILILNKVLTVLVLNLWRLLRSVQLLQSRLNCHVNLLFLWCLLLLSRVWLLLERIRAAWPEQGFAFLRIVAHRRCSRFWIVFAWLNLLSRRNLLIASIFLVNWVFIWTSSPEVVFFRFYSIVAVPLALLARNFFSLSNLSVNASGVLLKDRPSCSLLNPSRCHSISKSRVIN